MCVGVIGVCYDVLGCVRLRVEALSDERPGGKMGCVR